MENIKYTKETVLSEIEKNRNHSWFREVIRNDDLSNRIFKALEGGISKSDFIKAFPELDIPVFKYLVDNTVTKSEFVYESFTIARALRKVNIQKGTEYAVFLDRTPEYAYFIGATSIVAAKINSVCEKFSIEYMKNTVLQNCTSNIVFLQDTKLYKLQKLIEECKEIRFVAVPALASAHDLTTYTKYIEKYYPCDKDVIKVFKEKYPNVIAFCEFINDGNTYEGRVEEPSSLDDDFTVTYSSGTSGNPKGIVHCNRHYITMARYHDSAVSGLPNMGNLTAYSNIPSYSNSFVLSALSDNLIQNGLTMLDPVDVREYFPIGLKINKANFNFGSSSGWNILALNYFNNPEYKDYEIKDAIFNFAVGEGYGPGEEELGNRFLKAAKAGRRFPVSNHKKINLPFSIAMMSVAGGQCEMGSIFVRIHRRLFSKVTRRKIKTDPIGMETYNFVDIKILNEDGTYANPYEIGRVTVLSNCNMKYYNHDSDSTNAFYIKDAYGIKRADTKDYGYIDEHGNVTIKDRIHSKLKDQYEFKIEDAIGRDYKKIAVVKAVNISEKTFAAHIIIQPKRKINTVKLLEEMKKRIVAECGEEITVYARFRDWKQYYPLTKSLKVDKMALKQEGLNDAILIV